MAYKLTPWFPGAMKPKRSGFYQVQDHAMNCGCCWIRAHWDGEDWHTDLHTKPHFRTLLFQGHVKRWRGLAQKPSNDLGNRRDAGPIGGASELTDELASNGKE